MHLISWFSATALTRDLALSHVSLEQDVLSERRA